jgi:hypothetical protein
MVMRNATLGLVLLVSAACTGTTEPGTGSPSASGNQTTTYRDPAGWVADVPVSWNVLPFETTMGNASAIGTQISNVELPAPQIEPGLPIQASNLVMPPDGLALIIATDDDPENIQLPPPEPPTPPLSLTQFNEGSSTGDAPALSLLWFDADGQLLLVSIKTGPRISASDRAALAAFVQSVRLKN